MNCGAWNTREFFEAATVEDVTACLRAGADVTIRGYEGGTPLHFAARLSPDPAVVEALIAAGANVAAPADGGATPLHAAAWNANPSVTEVLLVAGAEVDPMSGRTPLYVAAENRNLAVVEILLGAGADPTPRDPTFGWTPLHEVVRGSPAGTAKDLEVIAALLAAGADPTARDMVGNAPLHEAARNAIPGAVEALLAGDADPRVRNERGWTPLHYVAEYTLCSVLSSSCRDAHPAAVIGALLAAGADLEARDGRRRPSDWRDAHVSDLGGGTPLHAVAGSSNEKTAPAIRALLAAGANLDVRDEGGNTPLHRAAAGPGGSRGSFVTERGSLHAGSAIDVLLDAGANATARNADDQTPWDLAQGNETLRGSNAYWRLNDARFGESTAPNKQRPFTPRPES